ncbi:MAG: hypothetical protein QM702_26315 [Rubrivivax sp.]
MTIDFRRTRVTFDPAQGREQRATGAVVFPSAVHKAEAAINGFYVAYNNGDHHLLAERIDIEAPRIEGATVFFDVLFLLRDASGNIDDPFSGYVDVLVIADRA